MVHSSYLHPHEPIPTTRTSLQFLKVRPTAAEEQGLVPVASKQGARPPPEPSPSFPVSGYPSFLLNLYPALCPETTRHVFSCCISLIHVLSTINSPRTHPMSSIDEGEHCHIISAWSCYLEKGSAWQVTLDYLGQCNCPHQGDTVLNFAPLASPTPVEQFTRSPGETLQDLT